MTKAPHPPDSKPDGGGASPFRRQPRNARGVFVKWGAPDALHLPERMDEPLAPLKPKRAATPAQLIARVSRVIESELDQIEQIVGMRGAKRSDAEKRARTLASLTRTLAEVTRLRHAGNEAKLDHDNDAVPRDLDEFRRSLQGRLARLVDRPEGEGDCGNDPG